MIDVVIILAASSVVLELAIMLEYLSRVNDWQEEIYDRLGKIIYQNNNLLKKLEEMDDLDGLEFIPIKGGNFYESTEDSGD